MTKYTHFPRVTDPFAAANNARMKRVGGVLTREIVAGQERDARFDVTMPERLITVPLIPWFANDIAASATTTMRMEIPSASGTFASTGVGTSIKMGTDGRVIGGELKCNANVTAGNMTVGVRIAGVDYLLSDLVANTTNPTGIMTIVPWASGVPFAEIETVQPVVITDAGFLPAGSIDIKVMLIAAFEAV
jgi:hypothetical protein